MLFSFVFTALVSVSQAASSTTVGSIALKPLDYDKYAELIDLQNLKFFPNGTVFIYDSESEVISNETEAISNATIASTGQFQIGSDYYLDVDRVSGLVSVSTDGTAANGIFYIEDEVLFYNYHSTFVACRTYEGSHMWSLFWRGASSVAVCENEWLLANLYPYAVAGSAVTQYLPDNFQTSVAETATENTQTTTATIGTQASKTVVTSSQASKNAGNNVQWGVGAGVAALVGYLL